MGPRTVAEPRAGIPGETPQQHIEYYLGRLVGISLPHAYIVGRLEQVVLEETGEVSPGSYTVTIPASEAGSAQVYFSLDDVRSLHDQRQGQGWTVVIHL